MRRGTGGNRFIPADASIPDLMRVIHEGLYELRDWATETGGHFDLAAISVDTVRIPSGAISVTVSGDLRPTTPTVTRESAGEETDRG